MFGKSSKAKAQAEATELGHVGGPEPSAMAGQVRENQRYANKGKKKKGKFVPFAKKKGGK